MTRSRVILDLRMWQKSGIGTYLRSLVPGLLRANGYEWHCLGDKIELEELKSQVRIHEASAPIYSVREQLELMSKGNGYDLFHAPHYNAPLFVNSQLVVTVHDLTHFRYPQYFGSSKKVELARFVMRRVLKKAAKIIAVSHSTKNDLVQMFGVDEKKIRVIYEGPGIGFKGVIGAKLADLPPRYFLYVGNLKTHKNIRRLLEAFLGSKREGLREDLVVVGAMDEKNQEKELIERLLGQNGIHHYAETAEAELKELYRRARGLIFPSLWEGFGLPILEAFQAEIPVACSRIPSHQEIYGESGFYFDPENREEMKRAIVSLATDEALRTRLVDEGRKRLRLFNWQRTAEETLSVYREVIGK